MEVDIRRATAEDAEQLSACFRDAYASVAARIRDLPDIAGGLELDIAENIVWIAEGDGMCLGGLVFEHRESVAHLMNVAVHPDARGMGLGRRLIGVAEAFAQEHGAKRIDLATHVGMPENVALYERLGWRETTRTDRKVTMSKSL